MLSTVKKTKLISAFKHYKKVYLDKGYGELDESATRLMINHFLTEILGYKMIEEIKTEYMIKGTYADYVVQTGENRHFLVEVKSFSLGLSEKHLRQTRNYGADEGIEWIILTNARKMELYKITFDKPVETTLVFSLDLSDNGMIKKNCNSLEYLHKDCVTKHELEKLWKKHSALSPTALSSYLFGKPVLSYIKRELNNKYKCRFSDEDISEGIKKILTNPICLENVKPVKSKKKKSKVYKEEIIPNNLNAEGNPT